MRRLAVIALALLCTVGCCRPGGMRDARERVLKDDLFTLRSVIDNYTYDKNAAPQSLDDLVSGGYLRAVPKDPITGKANWVLLQCETHASVDQSQIGICDVRSASQEEACDGTRYDSW